MLVVKEKHMIGKLFLISAPSGAGKTTLVQTLLARYATMYRLERVITYTSKQPRHNEQHGIDYYFISRSDFEEKIKAGFFMEWSSVYEAYYGSPRHVLADLSRGKSCVLIVDRVGVEQILKIEQRAVTIWIYTKTIEDLRNRLVNRCADTQQSIMHRLMCARNEIACEVNMPLYKYHILNDEFDDALENIVTIIKKELT